MNITTKFFGLRVRGGQFHLRLGTTEYGVQLHWQDQVGLYGGLYWGVAFYGR